MNGPAAVEISLLELSQRGRAVPAEELLRKTRMSDDSLSKILTSLEDRGLVKVIGQVIHVEQGRRLLLGERLIRGGLDLRRVSRFLEWQEFENFAANTLMQNGYHAVKRLIFKTSRGRRELDLLAWNDVFLFAVDCKHWSRGLSPSRMSDIALAQVERVEALAQRPEILVRRGLAEAEGRFMWPLIMTLSHTRQPFAEGVPFVSISELPSFLTGLSPVDDLMLSIRVAKPTGQTTLFIDPC